MKKETTIEGDDNRGRRSWAFASSGFTWLGLDGLGSGPSLSPKPECVWFFSYMTQSGFMLSFLFLVAVQVQALTELVGSGFEAMSGRQVVPVKLAVWSVDVFSFGQTRLHSLLDVKH